MRKHYHRNVLRQNINSYLPECTPWHFLENIFTWRWTKIPSVYSVKRKLWIVVHYRSWGGGGGDLGRGVIFPNISFKKFDI